jgi:hypothetical protein
MQTQSCVLTLQYVFHDTVATSDFAKLDYLAFALFGGIIGTTSAISCGTHTRPHVYQLFSHTLQQYVRLTFKTLREIPYVQSVPSKVLPCAS